MHLFTYLIIYFLYLSVCCIFTNVSIENITHPRLMKPDESFFTSSHQMFCNNHQYLIFHYKNHTFTLK